MHFLHFLVLQKCIISKVNVFFAQTVVVSYVHVCVFRVIISYSSLEKITYTIYICTFSVQA